MVEIKQVGNDVRIIKMCSVTNEVYGTIVSVAKYNRWKGGELIQNVFPEMEIGMREFLISGNTPEEFEAMFPQDEDIDPAGGYGLHSHI
jgi:hypothetical protein